MADQLRADWLGAAGHPTVATPHIDALATRGMRFTRAACNSPLCAPSRISLAGGYYPHRLGALDNNANFPAHRETYYQMLRRHGYRTCVVGKTDLHKADHWYGLSGDLPLLYHLGFTDPLDTEGKMNAAQPATDERGDWAPVGPYQAHLARKGLLDAFVDDYATRRRRPVYFASPSVLPDEDFHDSYIGQKACDMLENMPGESPWHMFVSFVGPHDPWDPPESRLARQRDNPYPAAIPLVAEGKPRWILERARRQSAGMSAEDEREVKRHYTAAIELIDDWVGRMLDVLAKRSMLQNTTILFTADHGELMGDHGLFQKSAMYEGAVRVPLIVTGPAVQSGAVSEALVSLVDLYPTILSLAGIAPPSDLDGTSITPLLAGEADHRRRYQFSELRNCRMIFDGRYKLIENANDETELYDVAVDPQEIRNIAQENPRKRRELQAVLQTIR